MGWSDYNRVLRENTGGGGLSAAFENFTTARTYRNSFENTTIRKEIKYQRSELVKRYTAHSLTRGWVDPVWETHHYYSTVTTISNLWNSFTDWWNSTDMFFTAEGKVDIGVQAGIDVHVAGAEVGVDARLISFDLLGVSVEQAKTSDHPYVYNYDYIGEGGYTTVNQHLGLSFIGGISGTHSFQVGNHIKNQQLLGEVNAAIFQGNYNYNPMTQTSNKAMSISVGGRAALILGIEGSVTIGVRDR